MAKMHELLAVESDLAGNYKRVRDEGINTLSKKPDHFFGHHKSLLMFDESRKNEEASAAQHKEMTTTVSEKIEWVNDSAINYFDALLQKESTNQTAKADLVIDGRTMAKDVPATFLLGMETKLREVRQLYEAAPTLPPGVKWEHAEQDGRGVWRTANPEVTEKTEKTVEHKIIVPATDKHPAQVEKWTANKVIGQFTTTKVSGAWTVAQKADCLGRIDKLLRAVKKARQRANTVEVVERKIAKELFDYISG